MNEIFMKIYYLTYFCCYINIQMFNLKIKTIYFSINFINISIFYVFYILNSFLLILNYFKVYYYENYLVWGSMDLQFLKNCEMVYFGGFSVIRIILI